ncbi:unnamed protein product [Leuciscus chuanchicus]
MNGSVSCVERSAGVSLTYCKCCHLDCTLLMREGTVRWKQRRTEGVLENKKEKKSSQVSPGPPFCAGPSPYDGVSSLPEKNYRAGRSAGLGAPPPLKAHTGCRRQTPRQKIHPDQFYQLSASATFIKPGPLASGGPPRRDTPLLEDSTFHQWPYCSA